MRIWVGSMQGTEMRFIVLFVESVKQHAQLTLGSPDRNSINEVQNFFLHPRICLALFCPPLSDKLDDISQP